MATTERTFRASPPQEILLEKLGLLKEFRGTWVGTGFNLIARPDFKTPPGFFLELNGTIENLEFTQIGGNIPNRGSEQPDINLFGLHYLQQVADCQTKGALHIEPGLWIHVPPTEDPVVANDTYVRQATIPHGDSLLAQSTTAISVKTGPDILPVDTFPFPITDPIPALNASAAHPLGPPYINQYLNSALPTCSVPPGLDSDGTIRDPTEVLRAAIKGQNITRTVVLVISTAAVSGSTGILNIPFVVTNANAQQMDAIFWIETVEPAGGEPFMQLQYVQRVILQFPAEPGGNVINWPHVSVATLVKQ